MIDALPRPTSRSARAALASLALLTLLISVALTVATSDRAAAATNASTEQSFVNLLNTYRTAHGRRALTVSSGARSVARGWSATMAGQDRLFHNPNMVSQLAGVARNYRIVGENVGYGWNVQSLHDAFVNSPPHRENMLESRFNYVGIGVSQAGSKIWVAVEFIGTPDHLAGAATSSTNAPTKPKVQAHRSTGPGATTAAPAPLGTQLFTQVSGGATTVHGYRNGTISGTTSLGGQARSAPAPASYGSSQAVAVRGSDDRIWIRSRGSGAWGPWHSLGGKTTHHPTLVGNAGGRLDLFVTGIDQHVWTRASTPGYGWGRWTRLDGILSTGPQAANVAGRLVLTGVGRDSAVYLSSRGSGGWSAWHRTGGLTRSAAAVTSRNNRPLIVVRGRDNHLYYAVLTSTAARAHWIGMGGSTASGPGLSTAGGVISLAIRGVDGRVWSRVMRGSWSGWARA